MKNLRKLMSILLLVSMLFTVLSAFAENETPPAMPDGNANEMGTPPEKPDGEAPGGNGMGTPPSGGAPGGIPGGGSSKPDTYDALSTYTEDTTLDGETIASTGTDENAVLVSDGEVTITNSTITRNSEDSTGGDNASFYGVGAAVLVTDGTVRIADTTIETDAQGGAGVFAYGDGVVYVSDTSIHTEKNTSGGIHVAGGGTLYARNLTVETEGGSSAAVRSDRGSGTMIVDGGTYTSHGSGSPAVYVTADITIQNATLVATGAEALCLEGLNSVRLYDCTLEGDMPENEQNDNDWNVILYQSMSGDSEVGEGSFEMVGGTLIAHNGGFFYSTNTDSVFTIQNVTLVSDEEPDYLLRVTGNSNARGWGLTGKNGANTIFTAIDQEMAGDVIYDSISNLTLYLVDGSTLTGAVLDDESCAGDGGDGTCTVILDATSTWVVTEDSLVTFLYNAGNMVDEDGRTVTVQSTDGTVYVEGESDITITVQAYSTDADLSNAGVTGSFEDYSAEIAW